MTGPITKNMRLRKAYQSIPFIDQGQNIKRLIFTRLIWKFYYETIL